MNKKKLYISSTGLKSKQGSKILKKRLKSLLTEQKHVFDEMQKDPLLQLCYPCGFGKGYIIGTDLLHQMVNSDRQIFAVCSHRLGLNDQHISDLFKLFIPFLGEVAFAFCGTTGGLDIDALSKENANELAGLIFDYNEGKPKNKQITAKGLTITTTDKLQLLEFIKENTQHRHVIIVSTYHSAGMLAQSELNINTLYCDEAHELAASFKEAYKERSFISNYLKIKSKRRFFFTATPKDCSDDPLNSYLMNNREIFGRRIGTSHLESVEKGYVVGLEVIRVRPSDFDTNFMMEFGSIESKAFYLAHAYRTHNTSIRIKSKNKLAPKVLVRCASVEKDMWPIFELLKTICPDVLLFASASKAGDGSSMNNNVIYLNNEPLEYNTDTKFTARSKPLTRKKYIEAIQSLTDEQPAIVLHHDTISEGLNVPGFTCFIPFSDTLMNFVKLYQNIGRVIRPHKTDRQLFIKGKLKIGEEGWIKPSAEVIIPYWSNVTYASEEKMAQIIIELETNLCAKTSLEIPNGDDLASGYHRPEIESVKKNIDNRKNTVNDLVYETVYNAQMFLKRRKEMNAETKDMNFIESLNYLYNNIL
jgi:hypothetical protein